jgi:hypothetical protein
MIKALSASFATIVKESKMIQMLLCVFLLQGARLYKMDNKCWQGVMTMLQSVCIGGFLMSENEGLGESIFGGAIVSAGGITAGLQCAEEAGWYPGKVLTGDVPWYLKPGHPIQNLLEELFGP